MRSAHERPCQRGIANLMLSVRDELAEPRVTLGTLIGNPSTSPPLSFDKGGEGRVSYV